MEIDPVTLTLEELMRMDSHALHQLAKKSAGTLTRYRAFLGRLLLAIERTDAYLDHGCSGGVHYAVVQLGFPVRKARALLLVSRELEALPLLRHLANHGEIEWSKLREIVRVATPETERCWAQLCHDHSYAEIENMVARCRRGDLPPERPTTSLAARSELRCHFEPDQMAVLERGLQLMCQLSGRVISMAEAIELLFAEKLAERPVDELQLQRVRRRATKDLRWIDLINAETEKCPDNSEIEIVNPHSRIPTPAQRRKLLRRDGHRCSVPGCQNTIWLDVHHIIHYADGGLTIPENLITLCCKCHKNVHENHLKIVGRAPHGVRFLNREGKDIRIERTLDIAYWCDIWCGWRGTRWDSRYQRAREALLTG